MRVKLCQGIGELGKSHCVMAATALLNGEEFSDRPECVSPAITGTLISLNDFYYNDVNGEDEKNRDPARDTELGHLPWVIIGTREPDSYRGMEILTSRVTKILTYMFPVDYRIGNHNLWLLLMKNLASASTAINESQEYVEDLLAKQQKQITLYGRSPGYVAAVATQFKQVRRDVNRAIVRALSEFETSQLRIQIANGNKLLHNDSAFQECLANLMREMTNAYRLLQQASVRVTRVHHDESRGELFDNVVTARRELIKLITDVVVPMHTTTPKEPSYQELMDVKKMPNLFLVK